LSCDAFEETPAKAVADKGRHFDCLRMAGPWPTQQPGHEADSTNAPHEQVGATPHMAFVVLWNLLA
jgi:hypothetical protein